VAAGKNMMMKNGNISMKCHIDSINGGGKDVKWRMMWRSVYQSGDSNRTKEMISSENNGDEKRRITGGAQQC
jgi:hypothetical protein